MVGADRAAEVVALLSEEPPREYGDDLAGAWRLARRGGDAYASRWRTESRRLRSASTGLSHPPARDSARGDGLEGGPWRPAAATIAWSRWWLP